MALSNLPEVQNDSDLSTYFEYFVSVDKFDDAVPPAEACNSFIINLSNIVGTLRLRSHSKDFVSMIALACEAFISSLLIEGISLKDGFKVETSCDPVIIKNQLTDAKGIKELPISSWNATRAVMFPIGNDYLGFLGPHGLLMNSDHIYGVPLRLVPSGAFRVSDAAKVIHSTKLQTIISVLDREIDNRSFLLAAKSSFVTGNEVKPSNPPATKASTAAIQSTVSAVDLAAYSKYIGVPDIEAFTVLQDEAKKSQMDTVAYLTSFWTTQKMAGNNVNLTLAQNEKMRALRTTAAPSAMASMPP
jgi:hypothetical protein